MLLRTRLSILVTAAFLVTSIIEIIAATSAGSLLIDEVDGVVLDHEDALWQSTVKAQSGLQFAFAATLSDDPALVDAAKRSDGDLMRKALETAQARARLAMRPDILQIVSANGQTPATLGSSGTDLPLVDQSTLDKLASGASLSGLKSAEAGKSFLVTAIPIQSDGQFLAAVVVASDSAKLVNAFAAANNTKVALLALRGQVVATNDADLWPRVRNAISLRDLDRTLVFDQSMVLSVSSIPLRDAFGALTGTLVTYRDVSKKFYEVAWIIGTAVALAVAMVVLAVILLWAYLAASFKPLMRTVDVTRALAKGDTSQDLEAVGSDEIGQISEAVVQLRINAVEAAELSRQRERTRRRRERLIRREVGGLADALDPAARADILAVLAGGPKSSTSDSGSSTHSSNQQLRLIAGVLRELVSRILDQHQTMSGMISELEEALATKDKLIGLQHQLEIARQVQLAILPRDYGDDPRVSIHGQMTPANEVGGDFYDCFMLDDTIMVMVVADVSGKGIPASLFMAVTRTLIRAVARFSRDPATLMAEVNDLLARENDQMLFVTACMGFLDLGTGSFRYVNAGHSAPIIVRSTGAVSELPQAKGIALAVTDLVTYGMIEIMLQPNDKLFLYTDGITEAQNSDGRLYGTERLFDLLDRFSSLDERLLCETIERDVRIFENGEAATDDLTCLAFRYLGESPMIRRDDRLAFPADRETELAL